MLHDSIHDDAQPVPQLEHPEKVVLLEQELLQPEFPPPPEVELPEQELLQEFGSSGISGSKSGPHRVNTIPPPIRARKGMVFTVTCFKKSRRWMFLFESFILFC